MICQRDNTANANANVTTAKLIVRLTFTYAVAIFKKFEDVTVIIFTYVCYSDFDRKIII